MINITTKEIKTLEVNWNGEKRKLQWNAKDPSLMTAVMDVIDSITTYYKDLAEAKDSKNVADVRRVLEHGLEVCESCTASLGFIFGEKFEGVLCADVCLALAMAVNAEMSATAIAVAKERRR